jgi:uncharacterized surface protein with fasciclin (FAS1) repeats
MLMKMQQMNTIYKLALMGLLMTLLFAACKKTEFMPAAEGEQVPYKPDATETVTELLGKTTDATLFYTAWKKSSIEEKIKEKGLNTNYTVLVPNNAAMAAAGLTEAKLAQMPKADVDSLMFFYTVLGSITQDQLQENSLPVKSMLINPGLRVPFYEGEIANGQRFDLYHYKHYLALSDGQLLINGKKSGKINYQPASNGALYFLGQTVKKPTKTVLEALEQDGRFTMFIELQRLSEYNFVETMVTQIEPLFGYKMSHEEYWQNYPDAREPYTKKWSIGPTPNPDYADPNITISTWFAPTDAAFKHAGFKSVADMLRFNETRGDVHFDEWMYMPAGGYPLDTIVNYHRDWGRFFAIKDPAYGLAYPNSTIFFSNDLTGDFLKDYYVNIGGTAQVQYAYKNPFAFTASKGQLFMTIKESGQAPVQIIETDINTLNGPIHVVDNLLLPKGFKLR